MAAIIVLVFSEDCLGNVENDDFLYFDYKHFQRYGYERSEGDKEDETNTPRARVAYTIFSQKCAKYGKPIKITIHKNK